MSLVANPDQIILVDKPAGISSFGVVAVVRRYLTRLLGRRVKVGHCGTLDPFATGLLILVSGRNTRRAGEFSGLDKVYQATIRLGARSTTGDPEGEITESHSRPPSLEHIREVLSQFTGQIQQVPPSYSAIKVNGRRAYQLARAGKPVVLSPRTVQVYSIELVSYSYPELVIKTKVSSGTYIRSLASDMGERLGIGAYTVALRRLSIGSYDVARAHQLRTEAESGKLTL